MYRLRSQALRIWKYRNRSADRPQCLAVYRGVRDRQASGGEFGENSPHLLGNIEKGKSKKKSSRHRQLYSCIINMAGNPMRYLLAAVSRRAPESEAVWQYAEDDRGAAATARVASQERQRIERSELIRWGEVSAAKLAGGENQTKPVSGTAQRAAMPLNHSHGDLRLTREGRLPYGFARR